MDFFRDNKPGLYHSKLSSTLNLEGDWETAHIEIKYPHNWQNITKDIYFGFMIQPVSTVKTEKLKELIGLYGKLANEHININFRLKDWQLMPETPLIKSGTEFVTV